MVGDWRGEGRGVEKEGNRGVRVGISRWTWGLAFQIIELIFFSFKPLNFENKVKGL